VRWFRSALRYYTICTLLCCYAAECVGGDVSMWRGRQWEGAAVNRGSVEELVASGAVLCSDVL